jgi:hypothetical protein
MILDAVLLRGGFRLVGGVVLGSLYWRGLRDTQRQLALAMAAVKV